MAYCKVCIGLFVIQMYENDYEKLIKTSRLTYRSLFVILKGKRVEIYV
jgi:hypothetical protein